MLGKTALLTMGFLAAFPLYAANMTSQPQNAKCAAVNGIQKCNLTLKGAINIKATSDTGDAIKIPLVLINEKMLGDLLLYQSHVYDDDHFKDVVKGEFVIDNLTARNEYIQYQVVLNGKNGLIAKTTGDMIVKPGKNQTIRLSNVPLNTKEIAKITTYEIKCISSNVKLHRV